VGMQNQRDGRAGTGAWMKTTFEAPLRARKNDFGHGIP
jgi:hypothetical protein